MRAAGYSVMYSGFDMKPIKTIAGIERYLTKSIDRVNNVAHEVLSGNKSGSSKSKTFFEFVKAICLNPTEEQIATYRQVIKALHGTRWHSESKNMRLLREEYENTYKGEEEDMPIEVYRTKVGINLWYAMTELGVSYRVKDIMTNCKVNNKDCELWEQLYKLIETSFSPSVIVNSIIDDYKVQLKNILRI